MYDGLYGSKQIPGTQGYPTLCQVFLPTFKATWQELCCPVLSIRYYAAKEAESQRMPAVLVGFTSSLQQVAYVVQEGL